MAYASWSVVFGEQPTAAKWNILGTNDASFNDGTGIGSATITPSKLATGASFAQVTTAETTTSTSYTDLATGGPAVTVTIGANGLALVAIQALADNSTINVRSLISFAVSGASTVAASDTYSANYRALSAASGGLTINSVTLITGLTAGSNTFTMKYKVSANTGTFGSTVSPRIISVIPL